MNATDEYGRLIFADDKSISKNDQTEFDQAFAIAAEMKEIESLPAPRNLSEREYKERRIQDLRAKDQAIRDRFHKKRDTFSEQKEELPASRSNSTDLPSAVQPDPPEPIPEESYLVGRDKISDFFKGHGIRSWNTITRKAEANGTPIERVGSGQGRGSMCRIRIADAVSVVNSNPKYKRL